MSPVPDAPDDARTVDDTEEPDSRPATSRGGLDDGSSHRSRAISTVAFPVLAVVALAALGCGLAASRVNADVIVSSLISTNKLTFYYWDQDRLASVVPLLTWPLQHPDANLLGQMMLNACAFFGLLLLFVRYHQARPISPAAAEHTMDSGPRTASALIITGLLTLAFLSSSAITVFLVEQLYAISFFTFLVGCTAILNRQRIGSAVGAIAIVVSLLIVPSTVLATPFVLLMRTRDAAARRRITVFVCAGAAFMISSLAAARFGTAGSANDDYTSFSVGRLLDGIGTAGDQILEGVRLLPTLFVVAVTLAWIVVAIRRRAAVLYSVAAALAFGVGWMLLFTANSWVESNLFFFRYYLPVFLALIFPAAGAAVWIVDRLVGAVQPRLGTTTLVRTLGVALGVVMLAMTLVGASVFRSDGIAALRSVAADARIAADQEVTVVIGPYWQAWPAVHATQAEGHGALAITYRSEALRSEIERRLTEDDAAGRATVWCEATDQSTCLSQLNLFMPTWSAQRIISDDPLIIVVKRAG